jgi:ureidoacrylate peracid hydrolase
MASDRIHDTNSRVVRIEALPQPVTIDPARTAGLVIDRQNDFGAKGGMFDWAGIDISMIQQAVGPSLSWCWAGDREPQSIHPICPPAIPRRTR